MNRERSKGTPSYSKLVAMYYLTQRSVIYEHSGQISKDVAVLIRRCEQWSPKFKEQLSAFDNEMITEALVHEFD